MILDQISFLTAIGFSSAALTVTLLVSWMVSRKDSYLLSWSIGMALVVAGVIAYSMLDQYVPAVQFMSFALLMAGFTFIYGGAVQFRTGTVSIPKVFSLGSATIGLTSSIFALGYSGIATAAANFGIAQLLGLSAFEYWAGRKEAALPLTLTVALYALTALSFVLCGLVLLIDGQYVLTARPENWAEDINSIMAIVGLTGIGALSLTLNHSRAARQHRSEAMTDALTGLLNRRALFDAHGSGRLAPGTAIIMFDLDHFKDINDRLGHAVGDCVLQDFAGLIRDGIRPADAAARLGGEEFCVVLTHLPQRSAAAVAERIRAAQELAGIAISSTVSAGVAISGVDGDSFEALLRDADEALYKAKSNGRNRVHAPGPRLVA
ncbi:GGDEF domain-containing protein [Devosia yakushimensis]|uniref:diguanylate cyclase n=1 Tax=Devosia yakushimensis TaxID=470028 RepID=A0ABQ5U9C8_9HYPH|nr:GGDEF domain-containing protein [Devosia yakushimensis]GLQ08719.1 GGDEF domain-containing protein [Devosia yakushimensis]